MPIGGVIVVDANPVAVVVADPTAALFWLKKLTTIPGVSSETVVVKVTVLPTYNVETDNVTLLKEANGTGVGEGVGAGVGVGFTMRGSLTGEVIVYAAIATEMDATTINVISIANMIVFFLVDDSIFCFLISLLFFLLF